MPKFQRRARAADHPDHGRIIHRLRVVDDGGFNFNVDIHIDMRKLLPHIFRALYGWGRQADLGLGGFGDTTIGNGAFYIRLRPVAKRSRDGNPTRGIRVTERGQNEAPDGEEAPDGAAGDQS